jgi:hypothetical protein
MILALLIITRTTHADPDKNSEEMELKLSSKVKLDNNITCVFDFPKGTKRQLALLYHLEPQKFNTYCN